MSFLCRKTKLLIPTLGSFEQLRLALAFTASNAHDVFVHLAELAIGCVVVTNCCGEALAHFA